MRTKKTYDPRQDRRDFTAGIIAIAIGVLIIAYGAGWDWDLTGWVVLIAAVFGSTANETYRRR